MEEEKEEKKEEKQKAQARKETRLANTISARCVKRRD
jgi:hypothetical protein